MPPQRFRKGGGVYPCRMSAPKMKAKATVREVSTETETVPAAEVATLAGKAATRAATLSAR